MLTDEQIRNMITDEQIRQLLANVLASADPGVQFAWHGVAASCREALGEIHLHGSCIEGARRRCVEFLALMPTPK